MEKARRRRWRSKRKGWHAEDLSGKRRSRDGVRRCCAGEEDWEEEVYERKGVGLEPSRYQVPGIKYGTRYFKPVKRE